MKKYLSRKEVLKMHDYQKIETKTTIRYHLILLKLDIIKKRYTLARILQNEPL